jgi:chromosome segregation ATPase
MNPDNATTTPGLAPTDPMLASALSGIEQGLAQIKRMSREADDLRLRLDAQQQALVKRESEIADRLTILQAECLQLETDRTALANDRKAMDELQASLDQRSGEVDRRQSDLDGRERSITEGESALAAKREEHSARWADLESRQRTIETREATLHEQQSALHAERESLAARSASLEADRKSVDERAAGFDARERELSARESALKDALAKVEQAEARSKRDQNDLTQLRQNLTSAQQQASQTIKALQEATTRAEQAEKAALDLRAELDQTAHAGEAAEKAERERDALRTAGEDLRGKLRAAEDREQRLSAAVKALKDQTEGITKERDEARAALNQAERRAKDAAGSLSEAGEKSQREIATLTAQLASLKASSEKAAAGQGGVEKELSDARLIIDDLRGQLDQHEKDSTELEGVLEQLKERLRTEAAKSEAFAAQNATLKQTLEERANVQPPIAAAAPSGGLSAERIRRLETARRLARDKARKIRRVGEALGKRYEQCEQVLSMRQDVLAAKRAVESAFKKQQSGEARSKAFSTMFFGACATSILGGASWLLAGQVAPEAYQARAVLAADSPDRELSAAELEEWTTFHAGMLEDPRFHEFASQRMARQGLPALGSATAVKDRIAKAIKPQSNKPGELTLEMTGVGREKTERELQMFAVAMQSQSREAKDRRADGANTIISVSAKAGDEPLDSVRLMYAGGIFGGVMLVFVVLVAIVWSRLAAAKMKFDQSNAVDATEDESRWKSFERKAA